MPPATRLSGGGFGSNNSPSNLDHILENFNQFKRKHITQNRDIIKTNALAQLRIKELEEKVLQLEGERAEKTLEMIRIRANMDRVERASRSVMRGWQLVGAGMAALGAIDGIQLAEPEELGMESHRNGTLQMKPSSRIVLNPHALPGGVSRSVARAPEVQLGDLAEEDSREMKGEDTEEGIETVEADDTEMMEEEGEEANITRSRDEDTIRVVLQSAAERRGDWMGDDFHERDSHLRDAGSSSTSESSISAAQQQSSRHLRIDQEDVRLHRATSIDSLSSFADDEEIQLSDDVDDEEGEEDVLKTILQESKRMAEEEDELYPAKNRKKRIPSTPSEDQSEVRSSTPSRLSGGTHSSSENDSPQVTRASRRSSARNGKSINYALPKLNTKMRKPDPADLIPAKEGEERRQGSEGVDVEDSSREVTPRRTLKGKNEAASTGNLREIRRQHQSAHKGEDSIEGSSAAVKWDQSPNSTIGSATKSGPITRRRSSTGPQPRKSNSGADREDQERGNLTDGETINEASTSWSTSSAVLPPSWKNSPPVSSRLSSSKSAANGTPIPRSNSGQHIKALKVANRIQKGNLTQPVFPNDVKKLNGRSGASAVAMLNGKVPLTPSAKPNQSKAISSNGETKRNSLHAAMTLDDEDQRSVPPHLS